MAETENSLRERVQMIAKRPRTLAAAVTDSRIPPALRGAMDFPNVQSIREGGVLNVTTTVADRHCLYIAYDVRLSNLPDDIQSAAWDDCSLTLKNPETGAYHPFSGSFGNLALKPRDGYRYSSADSRSPRLQGQA